jgi:thiol-disulfide isomerase/thioredoxin
MPSKTRKAAKGKVLQVDSKNKIPKFELELKNSTINFVLVYADWCGACDRFKKNIWNPMCKGAAKHNRMAVRDDMIKNTSLANAKFDYLPSLLVVDENGQLQSFETPDGETNAMPTPKNISEMKRIVNVPVMNITNQANFNKANANNLQVMPSSPTRPMSNMLTIEPLTLEPVNMANKSEDGVVYLPTPMVSPKQKGGRRTIRVPKFMRRFGLAFSRRFKKL